jgi:hypothetical protein
VNELNDPIAGDDHPFRLALSFGPCLSRLGQMCPHDIESAVDPTSRKLDRFNPLDLRMKNPDECRNIVPVECGVRLR